jgi:glutathione S-transferase
LITFQQGVEGVEKLFLRSFFIRKELDVIDQQGAWAAGEAFTLADIVLGLSVNRWKMTPFSHPHVPAIDAWFAKLNQRPAFLRHGNNGMV